MIVCDQVLCKVHFVDPWGMLPPPLLHRVNIDPLDHTVDDAASSESKNILGSINILVHF